MKTLKSIDGKSLLIGGLLASTIFFAVGATGPTDKWDKDQVWEHTDFKELKAQGLLEIVKENGFSTVRIKGGWEPYAFSEQNIFCRKRIK